MLLLRHCHHSVSSGRRPITTAPKTTTLAVIGARGFDFCHPSQIGLQPFLFALLLTTRVLGVRDGPLRVTGMLHISLPLPVACRVVPIGELRWGYGGCDELSSSEGCGVRGEGQLQLRVG